jgi:Hint domain
MERRRIEACLYRLLVTASGAERPIKWIGHQTLNVAMLATPSEAWPIEIMEGSFGGGLT